MAGMKFTSAMWCCIIVVVAAVASAPRGALAIGCSTVASELASCIPYLTGQNPIGDCCSGVKALYSAASTTPDRQSVCTCLKQLASNGNFDLGKAAGLPDQCGVSIPYKIDPSTNCATVQ